MFIIGNWLAPFFLFGLFFLSEWVGAAEIDDLSTDCSAFDFSISKISDVGQFKMHETAVYFAEITNTSSSDCKDNQILYVRKPTSDFSVFVEPNLITLKPGASAKVHIALTSNAKTLEGLHTVDLTFRERNGNQIIVRPLSYELLPRHSCEVLPDRELFIHDISVVDDTIRTTYEHPGHPQSGVWSFGYLMSQAAPEGVDPSEFTEQFFNLWMSDQKVNGFTVPSRSEIDWQVLALWPRLEDGRLNLEKSPFRLLAIVNRMDLRSLKRSSAGELRFVFGLMQFDGEPLPFNLIFEYQVPAYNKIKVKKLADRWHTLAALSFPSEEYNQSLARLTKQIVSKYNDPVLPKFKPLLTIRTNEASLKSPWELRQFRIPGTATALKQVAVENTPDLSWNNSSFLGDFINFYEPKILSGHYRVPRVFSGMAFRAGAALNSFPVWSAENIQSSNARAILARGTCNGCHAATETGTNFLHVRNRNKGLASDISGFLLGVMHADPITHENFLYNDLLRRKMDLQNLVCNCKDAECSFELEAQYKDHSQNETD
ncbi:MAG: hypothetical protein RL497_2693 [Pseudomonadota bacterium]